MTIPSERKYAIFAPNEFSSRASKTAHGILAYADDSAVAVIDPANASKRVCDVIPYLKSEAPIVSSVEEALKFSPTSLLVGLALPGGKLSKEWRSEILHAISSGLEIVSGLHDPLASDPEFSVAAKTYGTHIWDVREPPPANVFTGKAWDISPFVLLTVGNDCAVGKMTASLELTNASNAAGLKAEFVATGQTGIMIAGKGIAIDRVISDFAAGAVEQLVTQHNHDTKLLIVEGQGSISHPAFAPVTLALLFGAAPDALVLVYDPTIKHSIGLDHLVLEYSELISVYELLSSTVKACKVVGIALNTSSMGTEEASTLIKDIAFKTGLPVDDLVRNGPHNFFKAIQPFLKTKAPRRT